MKVSKSILARDLNIDRRTDKYLIVTSWPYYKLWLSWKDCNTFSSEILWYNIIKKRQRRV